MLPTLGAQPTNTNTGSGDQENYNLSGSNNRMYNAEVMHITENQQADNDDVATCRNALFLTDPSVDRANIVYSRGERVEGTCEWLEADSTYQSLLSGETRLLWIHGDAGKGKTFLSIYLTQMLERTGKAIYHFCSSEDNRRNNPCTILRSLLWQLTAIFPGLTSFLSDYLTVQHRAASVLSSPETLWSLFTRALQEIQSEPIFCVLDGLDECSEESQRWMAKKLIGLESMRTDKSFAHSLSVVILSRDIAGLRGCTQIALQSSESEHINGDIKAFVSARLQELTHQVELDAVFQEELRTELLQRAEGTFLWLGFAMSELLQKRTQSEVRIALNSLPKGLHGIYGRVITRINPDYRPIIVKMLQWVTLTVRPLSLGELATILNHGSLGTHVDSKTLRDYIVICEPFLRVRGDEIGLIHESARDYLLREEADPDPVLEQFRMIPQDVHLVLGQTCLDMLMRCPFNRRFALANLEDLSMSSLDSMLCYSIDYWSTHARLAEDRAIQLLDRLRDFFTPGSQVQRNWWVAYALRQPYGLSHIDTGLNISNWPLESFFSQKICCWHSLHAGRHWAVTQDSIPSPPPLHLACRLGITSWVRLLLDKERMRLKYMFRRPSNRRDRLGFTPLITAVGSGHAEVVRLLIDHKVNPNKRGPDMMPVLALATLVGDLSIIEILIEAHAEANIVGICEPLLEAARTGTVAVVEALLKYGTKVDFPDRFRRTPLLVAVTWRRIDMTQSLLSYGADTSCGDWYGNTAIHKAASMHHVQLVRTLLDYKADVNSKTISGMTALHSLTAGDDGFDKALGSTISMGLRHDFLTSGDGGVEVTRLLLDHKAGIDVVDAEGDTALHCAAVRGAVEIVQVLLERGANSDIKNRRGKTALDLTAPRRVNDGFLQGRVDIVAHLLRNVVQHPEGQLDG